MNSPDPVCRKPLPVAMVALLWGALTTIGYTIDSTLRWTDHAEGFKTGLLLSSLMLIASLCYGTPWILAVWALYRWRKWRRFRSAWMLAPPLAFFLAVPVLWVIDPPDAASRLRKVANVSLPAEAQNLRWHHEGPTLASGSSDIYYFEAPPDAVRRFIFELNLKRDPQYWPRGQSLPLRVPTGWPDPAHWPGGTRYYRDSPEILGPRHEVFTDGLATRVYFYSG